jgi:hypothetical protein
LEPDVPEASAYGGALIPPKRREQIKMKRTILVLAVGVLMLMLRVPTAWADSLDFTSTLEVANCSSATSCLSSLTTGPYGTVDVHWNSTTSATVTFTAASGYLFGDSSVVDVNVNGTFTATPGTGGTGFAFAGSGVVDGFGNFNGTFNQHDGFSNAVSTVSFTLTATGSTTWANAASVLVADSLGYDAAAHVFVCTDAACTANLMVNGTGLTGYVGEKTSSVPDGGMTLMLLGGALVGLETLRRKFRV